MWKKVMLVAGLVDAVAVPLCLFIAFYHYMFWEDPLKGIFWLLMCMWFGRGQGTKDD